MCWCAVCCNKATYFSVTNYSSKIHPQADNVTWLKAPEQVSKWTPSSDCHFVQRIYELQIWVFLFSKLAEALTKHIKKYKPNIQKLQHNDVLDTLCLHLCGRSLCLALSCFNTQSQIHAFVQFGVEELDWLALSSNPSPIRHLDELERLTMSQVLSPNISTGPQQCFFCSQTPKSCGKCENQKVTSCPWF